MSKSDTRIGATHLYRITTPLPEMALFWYMLLAFLVLGMLVADLLDLWGPRDLSLPTVELGLQIALMWRFRACGWASGFP